jgi:hypothetical protein
MPRITVTTDSSARTDEPVVLLDEHVQSVDLASGHAAAQLVERLAWAIIDAEHQDARADKRVSPREQIHAHDASIDARRRRSAGSAKDRLRALAVFLPVS